MEVGPGLFRWADICGDNRRSRGGDSCAKGIDIGHGYGRAAYCTCISKHTPTNDPPFDCPAAYALYWWRPGHRRGPPHSNNTGLRRRSRAQVPLGWSCSQLPVLSLSKPSSNEQHLHSDLLLSNTSRSKRYLKPSTITMGKSSQPRLHQDNHSKSPRAVCRISRDCDD